MDVDDFEKRLKVVVVGNAGVGKTSLATRFAKRSFSSEYHKTLGAEFMERSVRLKDLDETVTLLIWTLTNQEQAEGVANECFQGAGVAVYVFSTVDRQSFDDLPKWQLKVTAECGSIQQVLVQSKTDLMERAVVTREEVATMGEQLGMRVFRVSAKQSANVSEVFEHLCRQHLDCRAQCNVVKPEVQQPTATDIVATDSNTDSTTSRDLHNSPRRSRVGSSQISEVNTERRSSKSLSSSPSRSRLRSRSPSEVFPFPFSGLPPSTTSPTSQQQYGVAVACAWQSNATGGVELVSKPAGNRVSTIRKINDDRGVEFDTIESSHQSIKSRASGKKKRRACIVS